ncbi:MAG: transporter substrate-binding domain-containing protein [Betaproteobacteria bacterium]
MSLKLRKIVLAGICLGMMAGQLLAQEKTITWATNSNYPPYDWAKNDSEYAGACVELLSLIAPKGYVFRAVVTPWARAQEMVKRGEIDMLVNIRITPERSKWLDFSNNPTFPNPIVVFMRKDKVLPFKSWDELKPLQGGVTLGDAFGNGFDSYMTNNLKVEVIQNMSGNFAKLNAGRIDYFVSGYYMGMAFLSHAEYRDQITALSPPISKNSIHLGFSKLSPHRDVLPEIDRNLAKLGKDGTLNKILKSHLKKFAETTQPVFSE